MARGVNKIQGVYFTICGSIIQANSLTFNCDSTFSFNIHIVEHLILELSIGNLVTQLDHAIGEGGLAMINMSYNGEISDMFHKRMLITCYLNTIC